MTCPLCESGFNCEVHDAPDAPAYDAVRRVATNDDAPVVVDPIDSMFIRPKLYVRTLHPHHFRPGQWAEVIGLVWLGRRYGDNPRLGRPVIHVRFVDGVDDHWPIYDADGLYEFNGTPVSRDAFRVSEAP